MLRIAREGCSSLLEYLEIHPDMQRLIFADVQYKNLRFVVMELKLLISNSQNILGEKSLAYKEKLEIISSKVNDRSLFIKDVVQKNQLMSRDLLPSFKVILDKLFELNSDLINDLSPILFMPEDDKGKKKW
jgi:hypothetical protein